MHRFRRWVGELLPGIVLSGAAAFLAAIYGPLELFFTNTDVFTFDAGLLIPELCKLFAVLLALCLAGFVFCRLIYVRLYELALCCAGAGLMAALAQGLFLAGHLPPLDGQKIHWGAYHSQSLISTVLWGAIALGVVLLVRFLHMRRMRKVLTVTALFLSAVMLTTLISVGILQNGFAPKPQAVDTKAEEFTLSEDRNLVIFILDAVDARTFSQMLEGSDPEFGEILEDFTYFPNTVCAYPFTHQAIPFILHGQWYEHQEPFPDFNAKAMDASPLLRTLQEQGYRMGIYEEDLAKDYLSDKIYEIENVQPVRMEFASIKTLWKQELKLVWFKYAPFPLKRLARFHVEDFRSNLRIPDGTAPFHADNLDFYRDLNAAQITAVPERCFRFIHIEGAHVPFRYDKNVNLISEEQGTYEQNLQAAMTIFRAYLDKLKAAGLYDNTAIMLMSDHGYGNQRDVPILGRGNPLLAVKGLGESHPMAVSQAPISYEDLQEAYRRLLDGSLSGEVFDAREGDRRSRRLLLYAYGHEEHLEEYFQTGHAFDLTTLVPSGTVYEPKGAQ